MTQEAKNCFTKFDSEVAGTNIDPGLQSTLRKNALQAFKSNDRDALRSTIQQAIDEHNFGTATALRHALNDAEVVQNNTRKAIKILDTTKGETPHYASAADALAVGDDGRSTGGQAHIDLALTHGADKQTGRLMNYIDGLLPYLKANGKAYAEAISKAKGSTRKTPNLDALSSKEQEILSGVAKEFTAHADDIRNEVNAKGGNIGYDPDQVITLHYDPFKMANASLTSNLDKAANFFRDRRGTTKDYESFRDFMSPRIDWKGMEADFNAEPERKNNPSRIGSSKAKQEEFLKEFYDSRMGGGRSLDSTGQLVAEGEMGEVSLRPKTLKEFNPSSAYDHNSVLKYVSPAAVAEINERFGAGDMITAMNNQVRGMGRQSAALENLGHNPVANMTKVLDALQAHQQADPKLTPGDKAALKLEGDNARANILRTIEDLSGAGPRANDTAKLRMVRASMQALNLEVLGKVLFPHMNAVGSNFFAMGPDGFTGMRRFLLPLIEAKNSLTHEDGLDYTRNMGICSRSMLSEMHNISAFSSGGALSPEGWVGAANRIFLKASLLTGFSDIGRPAIPKAYSNEFAHYAGKSFEELKPGLQNLLNRYDISPEHWDIMRSKGAYEDAHGNKYLDTDLHRSDQFKDDPKGRRMADQASARFQQMFYDVSNAAFATPNYKTMHDEVWFKPDAKHPIMSLMSGQFQSVVAAMGHRVSGVAWNQRVNGSNMSSVAAMARYYGGMGMLGMGIVALEQMASGKNSLGFITDPDMEDSERLTHAAQLAAAGWDRSGVMGKWSALFLARSALSTVIPGMSQYDATPRLGGALLSHVERVGKALGHTFEGKDNRGEWADVGVDNVPFANLFYIRPIINYLALYGLHESLNPGYLQHMEGLARKQGNPYAFPPSEYAAQPFGD